MTVASAINRVSYAGDGVTVGFPVPFRFIENGHLDVRLRSTAGVENLLVLGTHYSVTGADVPAGGTLTMLSAPATGEVLVIRRVVPLVQAVDYVANDRFPAETHERALDWLTMAAQQQAEAQQRVLAISSTDGPYPLPALPGLSGRAGRLLAFDDAGSPVAGPTTGAVELALQAIVPGLEPGALPAVASRAALRALPKAGLADGDVVQTLGLLSAGDGGGGAYRWSASSLALDDGGLVLETDEGGAGRWLSMRTGMALTVTVGSGGTFATLKAALDWALTIRVTGTGSLTISLLSGDHALSGPYEFAHPDAHNITIRGQALTGSFPTVADCVGTKATDKAMVEGRFPSRIVVDCPGPAKNGLTLPAGIGLRDVAFVFSDNVRYGVTVGEFSASWQTGRGTGTLRLDNVAFFGGVWSIVCANGYIVNASKIFSAWHVTDGGTPAGGPLRLRSSTLVSDTNVVNKVYVYSPDAQYAIFADGCSHARLRTAMVVSGPLEGVHATDNSYVNVSYGTFSDIGIAITAEDGARVNAADCTFSTCDASTSSAPQEIWEGRSVTGRSIVWAGHNSAVSIQGSSFDNLLGSRFAYVSIDGSLVGNGVAIDNSKFTTRAIENDGGKVIVDADITNPVSGSINSVLTSSGGYTKLTGSSGFSSYSPAANTESADGSWTVV